MNGCIAKRKDVYYVRLTYYDKHHERKEKWVSTGLSGRGAKQKATAMIDSMIEKYSYLEKSDHPAKMADYLVMWKNLHKSEVAETMYDGYHTYIDRHLISYFKDLNLNIQDITAGHIFDYVNYLSNDGGRKDNKIGEAVDFENDTISINHTVVGGSHIVAKDSTKSYCSERTYQLLPDVKALLLQLKAQQEDYKRRLGSGYHNNDYIFKNPNGVPYRPDSLTRSFKRPWLVMDCLKCAIMIYAIQLPGS